MTEHRAARRQDLQWHGVVVDAEGAAICKCLLVNVSSSGAKLITEAPGKVPDHFTMILSSNGAVRRVCDVVWRKDGAVGVRFALSPGATEEVITYINDTLARLAPDSVEPE